MTERELKFRIWVHIDKAFTYFDIYDYPSGIAMGVSHPMQFIGIKDSQGNDVYEGDILKNYDPSGANAVVCYDESHCCFTCGGYALWDKYGDTLVIGNIIEHKHLLP